MNHADRLTSDDSPTILPLLPTTVNNHLSCHNHHCQSGKLVHFGTFDILYPTINMPPKAAKGEYIETVRHALKYHTTSSNS